MDSFIASKNKLTIIFSTTQAQRWIAAGYKTLEDLLEKAELTENQRVGVEHYDVSYNQRLVLYLTEAHM